MRQIILDLETTGLDSAQGHRIIDFSGLEMINRQLTGQNYQVYINPERLIEQGAQSIHGLTNDFLADKPIFSAVASTIAEFISGAELIIHNAVFDVGFLNTEFARLNMDPIEKICVGVIDTLHIAREIFPGKRNNLDALCDRFNINRSNRTLHGALTDCNLLAQVYLLLTRGQETLAINMDSQSQMKQFSSTLIIDQSALKIQLASEEECTSHENYLKQLGDNCIWYKYFGKGEISSV